jgi:hypothetical protein
LLSLDSGKTPTKTPISSNAASGTNSNAASEINSNAAPEIHSPMGMEKQVDWKKEKAFGENVRKTGRRGERMSMWKKKKKKKKKNQLDGGGLGIMPNI